VSRLAVPLVGAFASGMAPGLVAAAIAFMSVGDAAKSLFVSSAMCGMVAASLAGGFLADRLGRVGAMRLAGWMALLATPVLCVHDSIFPIAVIGRFVQGMGLGMFSVLLPLYIAETQSDSKRGSATAYYQFSNSLGGIIGSLLCLAVAASGLAPTVAWRVDVVLVLPVLALFVVGSHCLRPLAVDMVGACPRRAHGRLEVPTIKPFALAVVILALTSATGIGVVMHYSVVILSNAGLAGAWANGADAVMRVAGLLAALLSAAVIDRRGRRFVLRVGTAGAAVALFAVGALFLGLKTGSVPASGLAVAVFLCLFVAFFSFGPGVCVWVFAAEILPTPVRARGMSFALLGNQLVTAAASSAFLPVASRFGYAPLFFAFALAAGCYFVLASRVGKRQFNSEL
jgi:MFS family permease